MTEKFLSFPMAAVALLLATVSPSFGWAATSGAKIVVIDSTAVLRGSKVGQDVVRQVNGYREQAERDLKGEEMSLRQQGEALKQQLAILSADVKARKIKEFEARQARFQSEAQKKQNLIQGGLFKARMTIEQTLGPILQGIMVERGANLLLEKSTVLMGTDPSLDITRVAVQRLDQKMPSLKVELVPPPPGMIQQQQQAGPQ